MTEAEWLACDDPRELVGCLMRQGRVSERKGWLLAAACWRRAWHFLSNQRSRNGVEALEVLAEGLPIRDRDLCIVQDRPGDFVIEFGGQSTPLVRWGGGAGMIISVSRCTWRGTAVVPHSVCNALHSAEMVAEIEAVEAESLEREKYLRAVCPLCRDLFGNPFRPVSFISDWRTSTAIALAVQIYESRDFSALPILADALEESGCKNVDILGHCRGPGPHARGCWVIDLLTGRE